MTVQQSTRQAPRRPALDRDVAMRLAATEYQRVADLLEQLTPEQWSAPTDCTAWDVRAVAGHLLGMAQMAASLPEMVRQQAATARRAKRDGGLPLDAMTAIQVEKNSALSTQEVVNQMRRVGEKAARARRRSPSFVRGRTVPDPQHVDGGVEKWTFGFLLDVILTRDPFMHRIDITQATGLPMQATAEHEGVIVDDVVREWAGRHGAPYSLELTGPAGGRWEQGVGGEHHSLDAFELCRALSGRTQGAGLLSRQVPF